jgi:hypothetical protein
VWSAIVNGGGVKPVTDKNGLLLVPLVKSRYLTDDEVEQRKERKRQRQLYQRQPQKWREAMKDELYDAEKERKLKAYPVEIVYAESGKAFEFGGSNKFGARLPQVQQIPISQVAWAMYLPEEFQFGESKGSIRSVRDFSYYGQDEELEGALGEHQMSPQALQQAQQDLQNAAKLMAEMAKDAAQTAESCEAGLLSVKVEVPRVGQLLKFEKLLVSPTDEMRVELDYKLAHKPVKETGFWLSARETLRALFEGMMKSLRIIGVSLATAIPWLVSLAVLWWGYKRIRHKRATA